MPTPCSFTREASASSRGEAEGVTRLEQAAAAQHGIHRVGDEGAVAAAERAVVAEVVLEDDVGGAAPRQHHRERVHDGVELRAGEGGGHVSAP